MIPPLLAALLLVTIGDAAAHSPTRGRLVVIVRSTESITDLSLGDLRRIYLGQMTLWSDGRRIIPVVLPPDSVEERVFLRRVVRMNDIDYAQHWIGQVFRGEAAAAPTQVASSPAARRFVAEHPHAIAFISAADADNSVRVLRIDGKAPDAADYPLTW